VHLPWGAHPSQCYGHYDYDSAAFFAYDKASRSQESFDAYIQERVLADADHGAYVGRQDAAHLDSLRIGPGLGYVKGLKRR
jgi:glutaconate CoA-transferase subunit A